MIETVIRRASEADAEVLAAIGRETFIATFGPLYAPEDLADFLDARHRPEDYAAEVTDARSAAWLVERDGRVLGYATAGACTLPHPEVTPDCGELKRLYLIPAAQGAGVGARLLRTTLDWLQQPERRLWIGVYSENHGAQRLYARHGFEQVGDYYFPVGRQRDFEFILSRRG